MDRHLFLPTEWKEKWLRGDTGECVGLLGELREFPSDGFRFFFVKKVTESSLSVRVSCPGNTGFLAHFKGTVEVGYPEF